MDPNVIPFISICIFVFLSFSTSLPLFFLSFFLQEVDCTMQCIVLTYIQVLAQSFFFVLFFCRGSSKQIRTLLTFPPQTTFRSRFRNFTILGFFIHLEGHTRGPRQGCYCSLWAVRRGRIPSFLGHVDQTILLISTQDGFRRRSRTIANSSNINTFRNLRLKKEAIISSIIPLIDLISVDVVTSLYKRSWTHKIQKNCPPRDILVIYSHCSLGNIGRIQLCMMMQYGVLTIP